MVASGVGSGSSTSTMIVVQKAETMETVSRQCRQTATAEFGNTVLDEYAGTVGDFESAMLRLRWSSSAACRNSKILMRMSSGNSVMAGGGTDVSVEDMLQADLGRERDPKRGDTGDSFSPLPANGRHRIWKYSL